MSFVAVEMEANKRQIKIVLIAPIMVSKFCAMNSDYILTCGYLYLALEL